MKRWWEYALDALMFLLFLVVFWALGVGMAGKAMREEFMESGPCWRDRACCPWLEDQQ
jgi:hypothetical protein